MSTTLLSHAPELIAAHMRAAIGRRQTDQAGPFCIGFDTHSDDPFRNYAVPAGGARPTAGDVAALVACFRRHERIPRLEYVEASAPEVEAAVAAAGFSVELRTPVMVSGPGVVLTPREPAGVTVRAAAGDADLQAAAAVQHEAYAVPHPPGPHDVARLAGVVRRGGVVSVAVDDASDQVVGSGLVDVTGPGASVGELAAVAVRAAFRRRGIASALSVHLARTAHAQGVTLVFLEAEPSEELIYRRGGFVDVTTKIWMSLRLPGRVAGDLPGRVAGDVLGHNPDDHAHDLRRQRQECLAGTRSLVLLGEPYRESAAGILGERGTSPDLGVDLGVLLVVDGEADPRVAADIQVLAASGRRGDDQLITLPAYPDHGGLRASVRVYGGEHRWVRVIEKAADCLVQ